MPIGINKFLLKRERVERERKKLVFPTNSFHSIYMKEEHTFIYIYTFRNTYCSFSQQIYNCLNKGIKMNNYNIKNESFPKVSSDSNS